MPMTRFDAPGFLQDWNEAAAKKWSEWISSRLDEVRASDGSREGLSGYGPRLQFFNPLITPPGADAVDKDISWTAFPRIVQLQSISDRQRWRTADSSRDAQDEYREWSITRDPATDKIQRVTFTSEGPEYWEFLAAVAPAVVVELYKQHVSPDVKRADLFRNGRYEPRTAGTIRPPPVGCTSFSRTTRSAPRSNWRERRRSSAAATASCSPRRRN